MDACRWRNFPLRVELKEADESVLLAPKENMSKLEFLMPTHSAGCHHLIAVANKRNSVNDSCFFELSIEAGIDVMLIATMLLQFLNMPELANV